MGRYTFRLPDIGEGIAEAELVVWHVKVGDTVEEDAPLADMMTDKATVEMESPVSGTILEIGGKEGDMIAIGAPLVVIEVEGEGPKDEAAEIAGPAASATTPVPSPAAKAVQGARAAAQPVSLPLRGKVLAAPAVRARARTLGIDLSAVPPGSAGRITHAELDTFLQSPKPAAARPEEKAESDVLPGAGEQVKVIGLRRRIAEKMATAKRRIPHFSYVEECDVTALEDLRAELNAMRGDRPKLTMLPFLIVAICRALPEFPMINARFDDDAGIVTRYKAVHMGIATQTESGLMVPVLRDAQEMDLWQLSGEILRLAQSARDGSASSEELSGSTLTITSLGPLGGIASTPVINHPEVAIIGPNRIVERPVFVPDGAGGETIEKRKLMNISISCDHRVVDGWDAANFVQAVKRLLEAPMRLLPV